MDIVSTPSHYEDGKTIGNKYKEYMHEIEFQPRPTMRTVRRYYDDEEPRPTMRTVRRYYDDEDQLRATVSTPSHYEDGKTDLMKR